MSQQKVLFAVCLVAGLVAMVSGQSFDPMKCTQNAQTVLTDYSNQFSGMINELVRNLSKTGSSAVNIEGLTDDANKLVSQVSSLANVSQGFDAQRLMDTYYQIIQTQLSLGRHFINPQIGLDVFRHYMNFTSRLMSANTDLLTSISTACLPRANQAN